MNYIFVECYFSKIYVFVFLDCVVFFVWGEVCNVYDIVVDFVCEVVVNVLYLVKEVVSYFYIVVYVFWYFVFIVGVVVVWFLYGVFFKVGFIFN